MARLPWFEDFNDHAIRPPPEAEEPRPPPDERPTRARRPGPRAFSPDAAPVTPRARAKAGAPPRMCRRVAAIEHTLAAIADQSAATVGLLLLDVLTAALPAGRPIGWRRSWRRSGRSSRWNLGCISALPWRASCRCATCRRWPKPCRSAIGNSSSAGTLPRATTIRRIWPERSGRRSAPKQAGRQSSEHAKSVPPNPDEG